MNVLKAIAVLNRRAKTMQTLFGVQSEVFQKWATELAKYDIYTNKKGVLQLSKNKANKSQYRKLIAWAKREQKMPYSVLKRKADKYKKEIKDIFEDEDEDIFDDSDFLDIDTYNRFLNSCNDYFDSCYNIAILEDADDIYSRADYLYNNRSEYIRAWNDLFRQGAFDEYKKDYEEQHFWQEYKVDTETGEPYANPEFYEDWD